MTATAKAPKVREKLTMHEAVDLWRALQLAVEDHVDEIELNGGALPDWMAAMFDEVQLAMADRADALAFVIDEMKGNATAAKATKDRAARRQSVWENVVESVKAYALREVERSGEDRIRGTTSVLRIQKNSAPSTDLWAQADAHQDILLAAYDTAGALSRFITVARIATLDKKALGAAYEARREQLVAETPLLAESDIPDDVRARYGEPLSAEQIAAELERMRVQYIADNLAFEFPGVRCIRGHHLRID